MDEWNTLEEYSALYHERRRAAGPLFPPECHEAVVLDGKALDIEKELKAKIWSHEYTSELQASHSAILKERDAKRAIVYGFDAMLHRLAYPSEYRVLVDG